MRFKTTGGHRSGFEANTTDFLKKSKIVYEYEPKDKKVAYTKPSTKHSYLPDYVLANGIYIECKGRFTAADRKKMLLVVQQNPEIDVRMILQAPTNKINKGSKTTYADWCKKNNIQYGTSHVDILAWSQEPKLNKY